jgi:hypothetical protein
MGGDLLMPKNYKKVVNRLFVIGFSIAVLIPFQNCSKGDVSAGAFNSSGGTVNPALKIAPIPLETTLNQLSYMSCPVAGKSNVTADVHAFPYYTLKYGAFDNTNTVNPSNFLFYNGDNIGGIGFSKEAMDYLRRSNPTPVAASLAIYLRSSPYTSGMNVYSGLIQKDRATDSISQYAKGMSQVESVTTTNMQNYLSKASQIVGGGTVKMNYFGGLNLNRSVTGAISVPNNEGDETKFRSDLNNHFLVLGYVPTASAADPATGLAKLVGPDNDITKRLFARGYTFNFYSGMSAVYGVNEWDLNPAGYTSGAVNPTDLTTEEAQSWDCFNLLIVREVDRKAMKTLSDPPAVTFESTSVNLAMGDFVAPREVKNSAYGQLQEIYFDNDSADAVANPCDGVGTCGSLVAWNLINAKYGVRPPNPFIFKACPSEDFSTMTNQNKDRLKVARRFLQPEYFDINIAAGCVVPTQRAKQSGAQCYASGDDQPNFYIQYFNNFNSSNGIACGPGSNECPAYVSFCWRLH